MSLKIKTKLRYGIGLLFAMIVLLGGISVKNISDMSADTRNILADNYNSLLYSRRMLDALERIDSDPSAQADFEKNLGLQKKNITEVDENVATSHLVAQYEQLAKERNEENIRRVRLALNQVMSLNMASIYRKSQVAESTSQKALFLDLGDWPLLYGGRFRFFNTFPPFDKYPYPYVDGRYHGDR
mgnify:CR=1 FL=1